MHRLLYYFRLKWRKGTLISTMLRANVLLDLLFDLISKCIDIVNINRRKFSIELLICFGYYRRETDIPWWTARNVSECKLSIRAIRICIILDRKRNEREDQSPFCWPLSMVITHRWSMNWPSSPRLLMIIWHNLSSSFLFLFYKVNRSSKSR